MKRFRRFFQNPVNLASVNALSLTAIVIANIFWQVFCMPTPWAITVLSISFGAVVIYPLIQKRKKIVLLLSFINGISFSIFAYCIIFLGGHIALAIFLILFFGVGLLELVPYWVAGQLIWKHLVKPSNDMLRIGFICGILFSISIASYFGYLYNTKAQEISYSVKNNEVIKDDSWMTERILGMHFIYHTKICLFDGWRPPKHDPALVVGMWLNDNKDPLDIELSDRLALYKKTFPDRQYKFDCSCAIEEGPTYHADKLWKP